MAFGLQRLFLTLTRLDESTGPPWPMQVWNDVAGEWQTVGIIGGVGPTGPTGPTGPQGPQGPPGARAISGLLSLPPQRSGILDGNYLATTDGLAVLTSGGEPIATQPVRVVSMEEHILTSAGDVIAV